MSPLIFLELRLNYLSYEVLSRLNPPNGSDWFLHLPTPYIVIEWIRLVFTPSDPRNSLLSLCWTSRCRLTRVATSWILQYPTACPTGDQILCPTLEWDLWGLLPWKTTHSLISQSLSHKIKSDEKQQNLFCNTNNLVIYHYSIKFRVPWLISFSLLSWQLHAVFRCSACRHRNSLLSVSSSSPNISTLIILH